MEQEFLLEQNHLEQCLDVIRNNITYYEEKEKTYRKEITELFQAVRKGDGDSYGQLAASQNILEHTQNSLRKNHAALDKTYFGRIDYYDKTWNSQETCYIGKNGITRNQTDVIIVDWRAPVSSVYYENETGDGSYSVPDSSEIQITLQKKRTYDISAGKLLGYYDNDVAANDELLVKYLSQNKEAVLGDIIATIQKEQNLIIRDSPFKNIIVQGVAGSGKTTVALHRISYLLYNYEDRYKPSEFCIVGSSDMLLNYISSGLPELDVSHISQMRMDLFFPYLMGKAWKKKYRIVPDHPDAPVKSKLSFILTLEKFLAEYRKRALPYTEVRDEVLGLLLSRENMSETCRSNPGLSLFQLEKLLNTRIASRIRFLCPDDNDELKNRKLKEYRKYFDSSVHKWNELQIYLEFLEWLCETPEHLRLLLPSVSESHLLPDPQGRPVLASLLAVPKGLLDVYDAACLGLIRQRILMKKAEDEFSQLIIDEAQDFGEMIYYVLKQMLPGCHFTVMGDVSQNIRYETGMNDWEGLKKALFEKETDSFYLLAKSYRNTIEISDYAGRVLDKASQGAYKIQPVIRHGLPVDIRRTSPEELPDLLRGTVKETTAKGFETIAVVCRTDEDAVHVRELLGIPAEESASFHNGVMVLPVMLTKGLEFDAVILWKPDEEHYGQNPREAKLLYVAITRALHELHLLCCAPVTGLLEQN